MTWIPLLRLSENGSEFGLIEGQWGSSANGRFVTIESHPHSFLPFLEMEVPRILNRVDSAILSKGLSSAKLPGFPIVQVIKYGMHAPSEYWQNLAIQRVLECEDKSLFKDDLLTLVKTGLSQAVRHKSQKILASI